MRPVRFIAAQPHEVLGAVRHAGDVVEVGDDTAADLLRRPWMFEEVVEVASAPLAEASVVPKRKRMADASRE